MTGIRISHLRTTGLIKLDIALLEHADMAAFPRAPNGKELQRIFHSDSFPEY